MASIGEALWKETVDAAYWAYVDCLRSRLRDYMNNRPRIDTGEGIIYLEQDFDLIHRATCSEYGFELKKIEIDWGTYPDIKIFPPDYDYTHPLMSSEGGASDLDR